MKKLLSVLILGSFVLSLFGFLFNFNNKVEAQIVNPISIPFPTSTMSNCLNLQSNLRYGSTDYSTNGEVTKLQKFLMDKDYLDIYTGYFGKSTRSALILYQQEKGLYPAGQTGPLTKAAIYNDTCNGPVTTQPINPITYPCSINNQTYYNIDDYNNYCKNTTSYSYYCTINGQTYYNIFDYNNSCKTQNNTNPYYCILNGQNYYDWYSYNNGCKSNTSTYYCSINGQTYSNVIDYNNYCKNNQVNTAPDSCKVWYDGCNTCSRTSVGGSMACTMMACYTTGTSYCREYFNSTSPTPSVSSFSGPTTLNVNQSGTWSVGASISDNSQLSYSVTWGDENYSTYYYPASPVYTQNTTFTHTYSTAGTYTVTITVKSTNGQTTKSTATVVVSNRQTSSACTLNTQYQYNTSTGVRPCTCPAGSSEYGVPTTGFDVTPGYTKYQCLTPYVAPPVTVTGGTCALNTEYEYNWTTGAKSCTCPTGSYQSDRDYFTKDLQGNSIQVYTCVGNNEMYCSINGQTYYNISDYNSYCKSTQTNYCTVGVFSAGSPSCTCPSGYTLLTSNGGYQCINQAATSAPDSCKVWYDGCNTCTRPVLGASMSCTSLTCYTNYGSYCKESFNNSTPYISSFSGPTTLNLNQSGTWSVSASISDNSQLSYNVDWGDSGYYGGYTQDTTFAHTYFQAGTYTITINAKSIGGQTYKSTAVVTVTNQAYQLGTCALDTTYSPGTYNAKQCTCPTGSTEVNLNAGDNFYYQYKCVSNSNVSTSYCPTNMYFLDSQNTGCTCPSGKSKVAYYNYYICQ